MKNSGREWLTDNAENSYSEFMKSVSSQILNQDQPLPSDRAMSIMKDIWAKAFGGRRNSKNYNAALDLIESKIAA